MFEIKVRQQLDATQDEVWNIISDIYNDPHYWKRITEVRNIVREGNVIIRDVYRDKKNLYREEINLSPKEGLHIKFTKGTMKGKKDILLVTHGDTVILEVKMTYLMSTLSNITRKNIIKEIQDESQLALQLIKKKLKKHTIHYKCKDTMIVQ